MERAVELVRRGYEAFNRGDFDAAVEFLHPDVRWERVADVETPLAGRDAVREFMTPEVFERQHTEVREIEVVGDCVIVHATFYGHGQASGIELTQDGFNLWRIRDGLAAEFRYFLDHDEAVRAAKGEE